MQGILQSGACQARKYGYTSIDPKTPHSIIRKMMAETLCERCGKGLDWTVCVKGKTPHLHHSHDTGEIHGFTHVQCNPQALKNEIDNLRTENARLQTEIERLEYDLQDAYDTI